MFGERPAVSGDAFWRRTCLVRSSAAYRLTSIPAAGVRERAKVRQGDASCGQWLGVEPVLIIDY
jgi:hypothetical protein